MLNSIRKTVKEKKTMTIKEHKDEMIRPLKILQEQGNINKDINLDELDRNTLLLIAEISLKEMKNDNENFTINLFNNNIIKETEDDNICSMCGGLIDDDEDDEEQAENIRQMIKEGLEQGHFKHLTHDDIDKLNHRILDEFLNLVLFIDELGVALYGENLDEGVDDDE